MRIPTWIVALLCLAVPAAAMADGDAQAGKARAESAGCVACQGTNGIATASGLAIDKNVPNLAGEPTLYLQFQLVFFRKGVRKNQLMSSMAAQLSDDDIRNLGAFYGSLPLPKTPVPPDDAPEATKLGEQAVHAMRCANCHGSQLEGLENMGRLAGQREAYLYKALTDFKSGQRMPTAAVSMAEILYPLDDTQLKAVAHYLSRLR